MDLVHGENIIRSVNESNWKKQTLKGLMRERAFITINYINGEQILAKVAN